MPPATRAQQQTILRAFIRMTPTLQTLGQSLDRWQALYIVSITLALLATFAIVFFAFHKQHPGGVIFSDKWRAFFSTIRRASVLQTTELPHESEPRGSEPYFNE
jgi:hypothetical protein